MSDSEKTVQWDSLWEEYTKALENWKRLFEQVQTANNEMQNKFNEVWEKAAKETSLDTLKQFGETWQKSLNDAGLQAFQNFGQTWQKALGEANESAFKQFADNWQKALSQSGMEQMRAYGEMMKKFAETWNLMWPKHS